MHDHVHVQLSFVLNHSSIESMIPSKLEIAHAETWPRYGLAYSWNYVADSELMSFTYVKYQEYSKGSKRAVILGNWNEAIDGLGHTFGLDLKKPYKYLQIESGSISMKNYIQ